MGGVQKLTKESHAKFLNSIVECMKVFQKANEYIEKQTAKSFTPFFYSGLNENMSSDILADFLNPKGSHGQGVLFLEAFLEKFLFNGFTAYPEKAEVRCEAQTYNIAASARRIDILITFPDAILAIENKIGAGEQAKQVENYLQHIEIECKYSSKNFYLLYLTPSGGEPSEWSLSKGGIVNFEGDYSAIKWETVLDVLEMSSFKAPPEKLRVFIKDFRKALRKAHPCVK